jgi:hypothetical protein
LRTTPAPWYPEDRKPLHRSRTVAGGGIAATATTVATVGQTVRSLDPKGETAKGLFAEPLFIATLGVVALAFIGYMVWARLDDRRKGLR